MVKIIYTLRAFRGGSWRYSADLCDVRSRVDYSPVSRDGDLGFRVLRRIQQSKGGD